MYYTSSEKAKQLHTYTAYTVNVVNQTFLKSLRKKLRFCSICSCFSPTDEVKLLWPNYHVNKHTVINSESQY